MSIQKVCEICGALFKVPPVREATAKYCSRACRCVAVANGYKAKREPAFCGHCGHEMKVSPSVSKYGWGKFCSKACHTASMVGISLEKRSLDGSVTNGPGGYLRVRCDSHPFATKGCVFQHRLVIEDELVRVNPDHPFLEIVDGRKCLRRSIHVHHINEDKTDNRLENLIACTAAGHKDLHRGIKPMRGETFPEPEDARSNEPRRIDMNCVKCGDIFSVKLSVYKLRGAKYCSTKCASNYQGDLPPMIERECLVCGVKFTTKRHKVVEGIGKYCSNTCRGIARVGKFFPTKPQRKEP